MAAKIRIKTEEFKCAKCGHKNGQDGILLDRHHRRHQRFIIKVLARSGRQKTKLFKKLKAEYGQFLNKDITLLCPDCHVLVHDLYYDVTYRMCRRFNANPYAMTIPQIKQLMREYEKKCLEWIGKTP